MKKNKKITLLLLAIAIALGIGYVFKGSIRIGMPETEYPTLSKGTYRASDLKITSGKYAVYAKKGSGKVTIDNKEYDLSDELSKKAEKDLGRFKDSLIYEDSPKVEINSNTQISIVEENLEISFMKK